MVLSELDSYMQENETKMFSYNIWENKFKNRLNN